MDNLEAKTAVTYGSNLVTAADIEKFAFPMQAVGKVHVGDAEYAPGAIFDAKDLNTVNYLKVHKAATVWTREDAATAAPSAGVDTGEVAKADPDSTLDSASISEAAQSAQGTSNVGTNEGRAPARRR